MMRMILQTTRHRAGHVLIATVIAVLLAPVHASAEFTLKNRPSLRLGKVLRIDIRARVQTDFRSFSPDVETDEGTFDLNRARLQLEGKFLGNFDYQVEREFRDTFGGRDPKHPWRDVYVNFDHFDNFQIQAGKFKIPFSMEQLTSPTDLDFVRRALI